MRTLVLLLIAALFPAVSGAAPKPGTPAPRIPSAQEDLAWLTRYLDANAAGSRRVVVHSGREIPFASLPDRIGARIGVTLRDGRSRFGVLERASPRGARLRVRLAAGEYMFDFSRDEVQRITGGEG